LRGEPLDLVPTNDVARVTDGVIALSAAATALKDGERDDRANTDMLHNRNIGRWNSLSPKE
jgi:hypothetical protein